VPKSRADQTSQIRVDAILKPVQLVKHLTEKDRIALGGLCAFAETLGHPGAVGLLLRHVRRGPCFERRVTA
jgi:hypothetical protein